MDKMEIVKAVGKILSDLDDRYPTFSDSEKRVALKSAASTLEHIIEAKSQALMYAKYMNAES